MELQDTTTDTSPGAIELVRRFRGLRALVLGDAMLDTYIEGVAERLCTEGPVPVVRKSGEYHLPGGAANTAVNLAALGAEVLFLGLVGNDNVGRQLRYVLGQRGVDDRWLVTQEHEPTQHKLRLLANGQYVARFDEGGIHAFMPEENIQQRLLAQLEQAFALCDLVVISDYRYGVLSPRVLEHLHTLQAERHLPMIVDSKALHNFKGLDASVITPNIIEARQLVGMTGHKPTSLTSAPLLAEARILAERLHSLLTTRYVAITLGGEGVFLLDQQGHEQYLPTASVARAHDVGAGDSFTAALSLALTVTDDIVEAARIGLDAASIAVSRVHTASVSHHDLLQRVSLRSHSEQSKAGNGRVDALRLAAILEPERQAGKRLIFTNGIFDILHAGHIHLLRQARELGDILVVGVNSDASARRLKGAGRPINGLRERMALVSALDGVDYVVPFEEETPTKLIRLLRPHVHVKGGDYANEDLPEAGAVQEAGGQMIIIPLLGGMSTSAVIDRIARMAMLQQAPEHVSSVQEEGRGSW
ncbi:bifunctional protein HldE [Ktedonobacter sp. SOSP1-52]|uniref:D-glycero-beta-D-manno-heptose 1-phosphate adenylyltransferase n=1 Tax=Ktedonobacter sp. SOSP1-52 TaxID=2778366 RepID=UPI0019156A84|nr:D-glycero-beta-D-manno-heptose 1-phosphate adenylyltransferase [Ktedonobacter sp. SOSP1-52]GHO70750.1 bifunctional protein HldE [Ktedonobacter sp. SOSP1-52]